MTDRRYSEDEVAEIFDSATREARRALPGPGEGATAEAGLTLDQLQQIAGEVGIAPEAVARGAAALEVRRSSTEQLRRFSGVPIGASRGLRLPRTMTDDEWGRFVSLLRETFDAEGKVSVQGELREWRNGNLAVTLSPEGDGARLGMRTRRQGWEALPAAGGASVGMSLVVALAGFVKGDVSETLPGAVALLTMGTGAWTYGFLALRSWARERLEQFRGLGRVAAEVTSAGALPPGASGEDADD